MSKERIFYISYEICNYLNNRDINKRFEPYELCMYVSDLAKEIEYAIDTENYNGLEQYYDVLNDELKNIAGTLDVVTVGWLISLLDECKDM